MNFLAGAFLMGAEFDQTVCPEAMTHEDNAEVNLFTRGLSLWSQCEFSA